MDFLQGLLKTFSHIAELTSMAVPIVFVIMSKAAKVLALPSIDTKNKRIKYTSGKITITINFSEIDKFMYRFAMSLYDNVSIFRKIADYIHSSKKSKPAITSIAKLMLIKKSDSFASNIQVIAVLTVVAGIIEISLGEGYIELGTWFLIIYMGIVSASYYLTKYRIEAGKYGDNYYEAKEFLLFLIKYINDDSDGGNGLKELNIFEPQKDEVKSLIEGRQISGVRV